MVNLNFHKHAPVLKKKQCYYEYNGVYINYTCVMPMKDIGSKCSPLYLVFPQTHSRHFGSHFGYYVYMYVCMYK